MDFSSNRGYTIIAGMDRNCHSELYGLEINTRGEHLEDFIGQHSLKVENQGKTPAFQAAVGSSIIDVTLTARLSVTVKNWRVSTNPNFSDHNTIKYVLNIEQEHIPPTRKWVKMDWVEFRHSLTAENIRIMDSMTTSRLEKFLDQWYAQIENAIDKHCPKRKNKPKDLNNSWWSSKLQNQRKEIKILKKQNTLWSSEARQLLLKERKKIYKTD